MKRIFRVVVMCMCALLLSSSVYVGAEAAKEPVVAAPPANVTSLRGSAGGETSITLRWPKVKGVSGYYVYRVSGKKYTRVKTTSGSSCTITRLKAGTTYRYAVKAYKKVKKKTYVSKDYSNVATVTTKLRTPATPRNLVVTTTGSNQLYLKWNAAKYASGYEICVYDAKTKKYKVMAKVSRKTKSYYLRNLEYDTTYQIALRAYRQGGSTVSYGSYTKRVSGMPEEMSDAAKKIHGIRYTGKTKRSVIVYNYTKKKEQKLSKGTKVITTSKNPSGTVTAYLTNGNKIKIKGSDVKTYTLNYNSKNDYPKSVKEEYVNKKNLSSPTKYLIWLDQYKCRTNVFKGSKGKWKLVRTMKCGIGTYSNTSPKGVHSIRLKTRSGGITGGTELYITGVNGDGNAFHSDLGATLGRPVSHGCVRLKWNDLNWMYNTIPYRTTVYSA